MAGKGAPPLFDLIRTSDKSAPPPGYRPIQAPGPASRPGAPAQPPQDPRPPLKAAPAPEPKPEPRQRPEPEPDPEQAPQPAAAKRPEQEEVEPSGSVDQESEGGPRIDLKKKLSVPASVLYIAVPLILVGVLIAYSWGFNAGGRDRDEQLKPYLQPEDVVDPLVAGPGGASAPAGQANPAAKPVVPPPPEARQAQRPVQRPAGSPVTRDSRQADHNYLLIARMDGERAIKAAMALTERGLPTIAVETKGSRSNNWRLYSLLGIPSEKFRQEWQLRADHKAKVEAACRGLGADAGGPIDASTAYWEKYAP